MQSEITYKHILYTTEFSESWKEIFCHASGIAKQYKAKLTFLYVLNTELVDLLTFDVGLERSPSINKKFTEAKDFTENVRRKAVKKISDAFGEDTLKNINIVVERGNPVRIILRVAEEEKCDLIVMGFKGTTALEDHTIGSTVNRVLHRSPVPVLVIHNIENKIT